MRTHLPSLNAGLSVGITAGFTADFMSVQTVKAGYQREIKLLAITEKPMGLWSKGDKSPS